MRWILLAMAFGIFMVGCASLNSVGWVDLPDGSRLKAVEYESTTVIGTDINYVQVWHCPAQELGLKCEKAGEFGGSSPAMLKALFGNAAAAAAIGAGIALQDYEGDSVSMSGTSSSSSRAKASATSKSRSSSKARGGNATVNMPMMQMGGGGD